MFILGWVAILVLRANEVVIPHGVSLLVGILAIAEATLYVFMIALNIVAMYFIHKK